MTYKTFWERPEWQRLRYDTFTRDGFQCCLCKRGRESGTILHCDHIKPKSIYPELALDTDNVQTLCADCNMGKSNVYEHDHRVKHRSLTPEDLSECARLKALSPEDYKEETIIKIRSFFQ